MIRQETLSHRLILPSDANHYGTLYAGSLLRISLEAAYATAFRWVGTDAKLVLRRVLSVECIRPVPLGTVVEIRGRVLQLHRAYMVVGLLGTPFDNKPVPWMDGLMGFVHIDGDGQATPFSDDLVFDSAHGEDWEELNLRLEMLARLR
ncbi:MAG: hotdog domain-containing protein [Planctomycetota bacterium]